MKLLLLISICFLSTALFAQIDNEELLKKRLEDVTGKPKGALQNAPRVYSLPLQIDPTSAPGGSITFQRVPAGVYSLPQDGMPCIVPDVKDIAAIPNAHPNVSVPFITTIPNAYHKNIEKKDLVK